MAGAEPEIPLPGQIQPSSSAKPIITKYTSVASALRSLPSNTDAFLTRLQKCLSTPAGTDTILLFVCYAAAALSPLFASASLTTLHVRARRLVGLAISVPGGGSAAEVLVSPASPTWLAAQLLGASKRLKALSGLLSDVRAFSRLWGLLGMYFWAKRLILAKPSPSGPPPPKGIDKVLAYAILSAGTVFQAMENVAYLGGKHVLPVSPQRQRQLWLWCSRFWALYVGLDIIRLLRELVDGRKTRHARRVARAKAAAENMDPAAAAEAEKTVEEEEKEWLEKWRAGFLRQCAWAPVTWHFSSKKPLLGDATIGLLGMLPGIIQIRQLWADARKA